MKLCLLQLNIVRMFKGFLNYTYGITTGRGKLHSFALRNKWTVPLMRTKCIFHTYKISILILYPSYRCGTQCHLNFCTSNCGQTNFFFRKLSIIDFFHHFLFFFLFIKVIFEQIVVNHNFILIQLHFCTTLCSRTDSLVCQSYI